MLRALGFIRTGGLPPLRSAAALPARKAPASKLAAARAVSSTPPAQSTFSALDLPPNLILGDPTILNTPPPPPPELPSIPTDIEVPVERLAVAEYITPPRLRDDRPDEGSEEAERFEMSVENKVAADAAAAAADAVPLRNIMLDARVFAVPARLDILHEVVRWQRAGWRQGSGKTKNLNEIRGSGKKPWAQKGSGRARVGHRRNAIWKGGHKAHGPGKRHYIDGNRDFSFKLNKKLLRKALAMALSLKVREGRLTVVEKLEAPTYKTGPLKAALERRRWGSVLFVEGSSPAPLPPVIPYHRSRGVPPRKLPTGPPKAPRNYPLPIVEPSQGRRNFEMGLRSIRHMDLTPERRLSVFQIFKTRRLVLTEEAVERLHLRLIEEHRMERGCWPHLKADPGAFVKPRPQAWFEKSGALEAEQARSVVNEARAEARATLKEAWETPE